MLTTEEQLRYSRQTLLAQIGEQGQLHLLNACVLIVGIGGLGNPAALYLAAAGVGKLILADGDVVETSNLARQILFSIDDNGSNKAEIAGDKLSLQFPDCEIEVIDEMLDQELAIELINQADVVLDCSDNLTTRYLINRLCVQQKTPLVIGAATGFDGQHLVVNSQQKETACYQCLYPDTEKAPANNCKTAGILGPVLAMIAGMQSLSAIKLLTNNQAQTNQLSLFDGLTTQWQQFKLSKNSNCPICNG